MVQWPNVIRGTQKCIAFLGNKFWNQSLLPVVLKMCPVNSKTKLGTNKEKICLSEIVSKVSLKFQSQPFMRRLQNFNKTRHQLSLISPLDQHAIKGQEEKLLSEPSLLKFLNSLSNKIVF